MFQLTTTSSLCQTATATCNASLLNRAGMMPTRMYSSASAEHSIATGNTRNGRPRKTLIIWLRLGSGQAAISSSTNVDTNNSSEATCSQLKNTSVARRLSGASSANRKLGTVVSRQSLIDGQAVLALPEPRFAGFGRVAAAIAADPRHPRSSPLPGRPMHDVINRPRILNAQLPSHAPRLRPASTLRQEAVQSN